MLGRLELFEPAETLPDNVVRFLDHHQIDQSEVMDARGNKPAQYLPSMEALGFAFVTNTWKDCLRGHSLKNRHGQCLICHPRSLKFAERHRAKGTLFVAKSSTHQHDGKPLVKIGVAEKAVSNRHDSMNREGYGGAFNWRIVYQSRVPQAGAVKSDIKAHLFSFKVPQRFYRVTNVPVEAGDIFAIDPVEAVRIAKSLVTKALENGTR